MNHQSDFPLPCAAQPLPAAALHDSMTFASAAGGADDSWPTEMRRLLAHVLSDESALYATTRVWRHAVAGRKFTRLRALLDEQFGEIGIRLVQLSGRSRELALHSTVHAAARPPRAAMAAGTLEVHIMRELLDQHGALLVRLEAGRARAEHFHDRKTADLLADLIANHQKDAFMLRALLWEVQNTAA